MFINAAVQQSMRTLEIKDYPFTPEALAHSFRQVCLKNHPDHNNSPESHDKMIKINEAYNFLKDYADTNAGDAEKIPASIRDRILHAKEEMDKKIEKDMFTYAETCSNCHGEGYIIRSHVESEPCPNCTRVGEVIWENKPEVSALRRRLCLKMLFPHANNPSGFKVLKCKYCEDGKFTLRSGRKVPCKACGGTSVWKAVRCNVCYGTRYVDGVRVKKSHVCSTCGGAGKIIIELNNPVIPRGAVL